MQGIAAAHDAVDEDGPIRVLQQFEAGIFNQVSHQWRKSIGAIVDYAIAVGLQDIHHQRIETLRINGTGLGHHGDVLDVHRLVAGKGRVFLIGVIATQKLGVLVFHPLRNNRRDECFSYTAFSLQDEMNCILHVAARIQRLSVTSYETEN